VWYQNEEMPRPSLKDITAADEFNGTAQERREINQTYLQKEQESKEVIVPWNRKDRKLQKLGLEVLGIRF